MFLFIIIILEVGYIIVISVNFFQLKSGLLFWWVEVNWGGSNAHLKRLNCRKSQKETGSSEELCVYLTMVFLNKKMKVLLIVLSVSVRLSVFVLR